MHLNNKATRALLDIGSCVSVISKAFDESSLSDIDMKLLNGILNIECTDGNRLQELGFIESNITSIEGIPRSKQILCNFFSNTQFKEY